MTIETRPLMNFEVDVGKPSTIDGGEHGRRFIPITVQAQVAWAVSQGVDAAVGFVEEQIVAGAFDGVVARCRATTRKGKACQRTPLPNRDYCPSHQHLERSKAAA